MAGEEQTDSSGKYDMRGASGRAAKYWPTILKVVELILSVVCIALIDDPAMHLRPRPFIMQRTVSLVYATFASFIIFTSVYIIAKCIKDTINWKTSAIASFVGTVMYIACGALLLRDWVDTKERNYWPPMTMRLDFVCATGFLSIFAAVLFLGDLIMTVVSGIRGKLE